jgi:hypothetical protein
MEDEKQRCASHPRWLIAEAQRYRFNLRGGTRGDLSEDSASVRHLYHPRKNSASRSGGPVEVVEDRQLQLVEVLHVL